jgi:murein DD-endopeptidase MepM/ murein hydrolase activator NlpD
MLRMPLHAGEVAQHFGEYRGTYEGVAYGGYHTGTDFEVVPDSPVLAMATGKVIRIGLLFDDPEAGGWYSVIDHPQFGIHTQYLHTKEPLVKVDDTVQAGQVIAEIIQPTRFPPHLHIEVKPRQISMLKADGSTAYIVNATTSPKGNLGYALSKDDLQRFWIDPISLMSTPLQAKNQ